MRKTLGLFAFALFAFVFLNSFVLAEENGTNSSTPSQPLISCTDSDNGINQFFKSQPARKDCSSGHKTKLHILGAFGEV